MQRIAIVTPVFDDQESFSQLCRHVSALQTPRGPWFHIVAVDDGSFVAPPRPEAIADAGLSGDILRLARNVGHQAAIAIGLAHVSAVGGFDACVVMDSDGEDRPETIPLLLEAISSGRAEVAAGQRARRSESLSFQTFYWIYRHFFKLLTGQKLRFGNFMALTPRGLDRLSGMFEASTHVAAATVKARMPRADVPIDRGKRFAGKSKMNFPSLVLHGMRAVMVFADLVLTRLVLGMVMFSGFVVLGLIAALGMKFLGLATPGWMTMVVGFALSLFLQVGLVTMVTLIVSSFNRPETPPRVRERALEFIAKVERVRAQQPAAPVPAQ